MKGSRLKLIGITVLAVLVIVFGIWMALQAHEKAEAKKVVVQFLDAYVNYELEDLGDICEEEIGMALLYDALPNDLYDYIDYYSEKYGFGDEEEYSAGIEQQIDALTDRMYGDYITGYEIGDSSGDRTSRSYEATLTLGYDPHVLSDFTETAEFPEKFERYDDMVAAILAQVSSRLDGSGSLTAPATVYVEKDEDSGKWLISNVYVEGYSEEDVLAELGESDGDGMAIDPSTITEEDLEGMTDEEKEEFFNLIEENEPAETDDEENAE